ncbi:MAG TPA: hypothetical protein VMU51_20710 [Mycobacteriales bacterium]|nr:hypothetical protein [Mycobacteriales bacterium]
MAQPGTPATPTSPEGYAPTFTVRIGGRLADAATIGDVLDVKVTRDIDEMTGFDLTLNNWDDVKRQFKYSDDHLFDLGQAVSIQLGYADSQVTVASGNITTMAPAFPNGASPTIAISGQDGLQLLKNRKPAPGDRTSWDNATDAEIVTEIARRNKLVPVVDASEPRHGNVVQKNQDDAQFLMERAKRIDYDCYILPGEQDGQQKLFFVRPRDGRDGNEVRIYQLAYGPGLSTGPSRLTPPTHQPAGAAVGPTTVSGAAPPRPIPNLLEFTPTMTLAKQVGKVTVRGWDQRAKAPFSYTAEPKDLPSAPGQKGTSGPEQAAQKLGDRQEVVVDAPVSSDEEARKLAISLLRERAYEYITATGRIAGLPELRPSDNLVIYGLGHRFSGTYFVKRVEHTLSGSGFFTQFTARRVFDGGLP